MSSDLEHNPEIKCFYNVPLSTPQQVIRDKLQTAIREIKTRINEIKKESIHPEAIANIKKEIPNLPSTPKTMFLTRKVNKILNKFVKAQQAAIRNHVQLLKGMKKSCDHLLRSHSRPFLPRLELVTIPAKTIIHDATIRYEFQFKSIISTLEKISEDYTHRSVIFRTPLESLQINPVLEFLASHRNNRTGWFPRTTASDRIGILFIVNFSNQLNTESPALFLSSIRQLVTTFSQQINISNTIYFSVLYLICYREAFDFVFPKFSPANEHDNIKIPEPNSKLCDYCEEAKQQFSIASHLLEMSLFENNPIDVGYYFTAINNVVANIVNLQNVSCGKEASALIPADETLEVWQTLIYENQFTYGFDYFDLLDTFTSHQDYPEQFKYSCQTVQVALGEMKTRME